jgi:hypothetical protein
LPGVRFVVWCLANWSRLYGPDADPTTTFSEMWRMVRWPLLGIAIFAIGWLWALATSLRLILSAGKTGPENLPPRLG